MLASVKKALGLLDRRSRRILLILVIIQVLVASLDLLGVLLFGVVAALSASAITGQPAVSVDHLLATLGLSEYNMAHLTLAVAAAAGLALVTKSLLSFILMRRSLRFLANRQAMVSSRLAARLLSRSLLEVQRNSSQSNAYALVQGVNAATIGILGNGIAVLTESAVLLVLAFGLLALDPIVAIFTIVFFTALALTLNQVLGKWARRVGAQVSEAEIASITAVQDALRAYRETYVSGRRVLFVERFQDLRWQAARHLADIQIMNQLSKYVFEVGLIIGGATLALSQLLTREVVAAVTVIAVFVTAASRVMPSLLRLQQAAIWIRQSAGIAAPTFVLQAELESSAEDFHVDPLVRERVLSGAAAGYSGFVSTSSLNCVSLTYPGADRPALRNANLCIKSGESLALVGPTGAGKSTIAELVLGLLQPDSGTVTLSERSPNEAISSWPGAVAYVPQDVAVLNGTIRDNVGLGIPGERLSDDLVWEALQRAHFAETLQRERDGLDTVVGEHGVRLSGGQRQRLGLARALYTRPRFMVLDEATSALDAETERAISEALQALGGEVTLVIVAHRLATIRHCTQVAYIEGGEIQELGTFEEVRASQPNFNRQAGLLGL